MNNELNIKLDELLDLLDKNAYLNNMINYQKLVKDHTKSLIDEYHLYPNIKLKEEILKDTNYREYLNNENNFNYLIMEINKRFRSKHACHKW